MVTAHSGTKGVGVVVNLNGTNEITIELNVVEGPMITLQPHENCQIPWGNGGIKNHPKDQNN